MRILSIRQILLIVVAFVIAENSVSGAFLGFTPRHSPDDRGAETIATGGVPIHDPADGD